MEEEVVLHQSQGNSHFDLGSSWMENTEGVPCSLIVLAQKSEALVVPGCKYTSRFEELASIPWVDMVQRLQRNFQNSGYSHLQRPTG